MIRSLFENKRLVIVFAAVGLLALTMLAISLNEIPFREGQRFVQTPQGTVEVDAREVIDAWVAIPWWRQASIWVLLGILVILLGYMLSPELRRLLIRRFIRFTLTFWGILYIFTNYRHLIPALNIEPIEIAPGQAAEGSSAAAPVFVPSEISSTFSYVVSFAVALLVLVVLWAAYRGWQKYTALTRQEPLHEIARIARSSLKDLSAGRDSGDVIVNCYVRMSEVVSARRQLQRSAAMTPQEFALRLEQAGLPRDAVTRLTGLFEAVRYGDRRSSQKDVNEAVGCLTSILKYCGEPV